MTSYVRRDPPSGSMLSAVEASLPIRLIATPREQLMTADPDERFGEVERRNVDDYDHIPVVDRTGNGFRVIGLIDFPNLSCDVARETPVREVMVPLSSEDLIGEGGSILSFVRTAVDRPCRLVVSDTGVSGLVTLSDLQQLPVRACLFALITHLEMTFAAAIEREFGGTDQWLTHLSPKRACEVQSKAAASKSGDGFVSLLLFTEFSDKFDIIRKSARLPFSNGQIDKQKRKIIGLRDHIAHANNYADTRARAKETCAMVKLIDDWLVQLEDWPKAIAYA